jgi:hypothetical protein
MEYGAKGREPAAEGGPSLARKGVWGGREPGAEGSLGQKGVWGGRKSDLHNHQAIVQPRRNHQAIVQPRLYDCLMVTQITLPPSLSGADFRHGRGADRFSTVCDSESAWGGAVGWVRSKRDPDSDSESLQGTPVAQWSLPVPQWH